MDALTYPEAQEIVGSSGFLGSHGSNMPSTSHLATIGTVKWMKNHQSLAKLNIQAHLNVASKRDEYVTELILEHDKGFLLVRELLAINFWTRNIFPSLLESIADHRNSMVLYMTMYHEATVANLLEVAVNDPSFVETLSKSEHDMIDIIGYCHARVLSLQSCSVPPVPMAISSKGNNISMDDSESIQKYLDINVQDQLRDQKAELDYGLSMNALVILRLITDQIDKLPMSVLNELLVNYDVVILIVAILKREPWLYREPGSGKTRVFEDGQWRDLPREDLPRITKLQAQTWLILYNLLLDPESQRKYLLDEHRKEVVLSIRPLVTEHLTNQLPILELLQRYLDELVLCNVPKSLPHNRFVQEISNDSVVEQLQQSFLKDRETILKCQFRIFTSYDMKDLQAIATGLSQLYDLNQLDAILPTTESKCANCGGLAEKRCSRCKGDWYCSRECQVKHWPCHKSSCQVKQEPSH